MLVAALVVGGCSEENTAGRDTSEDFLEGTLSSSDGGPKTTPLTTPPPETTGGADRRAGAGASEVVLRLEGDPRTSFSGLCTAGPEESIIRGRVPQRYRFDLGGGELSCRIKKLDSGSGNLRVVLLAGDNTRSVQQTNSRDGILKLSYTSG